MLPMMMLAMAGPKTVTQTFTANTVWTAPAGVDKVSILGKGADGSDVHPESTSTGVASVTYLTVGSGSPGSAAWESAQNAADYNLAQALAGGTVALQTLRLTRYADGTQDEIIAPATIARVVAGSASLSYDGDWHASGPISSSGQAFLQYDYLVDGAPGQSATGFGKTFPGGATASAAIPAPYANLPVTPGQSYSLVIPDGGSITITYTA